MIKGYFGVPGCGKSTKLVQIYKKNKKKYKYFYSVNIDIMGCKRITKEDWRKYKFHDCLVLWDEITLDYDNRNYKDFTEEDKEAFLLHRHFGIDLVYVTQNYENVDKKVRDLTQELWYMSKTVVPLLTEFTTCKKIYRTININENTSELVLGYRFCNIIEGLFVRNFEITFRRIFYKYFNSWDELTMKDRRDYEESHNTNNINNDIDIVI